MVGKKLNLAGATVFVAFMAVLPLVITAGVGLAEGTFVMEEGVLLDMTMPLMSGSGTALAGATTPPMAMP